MLVHEVRVVLLGPEAADRGVVEFWQGDERLGLTLLRDEQVVLEIDPRHDGRPIIVGAHSLAAALADAQRHLTPHEP